MDVVLYTQGNTRVGESASSLAPIVPIMAGSGYAVGCMESVIDGHRVSDAVTLKL